jgi:hypothetical protein
MCGAPYMYGGSCSAEPVRTLVNPALFFSTLIDQWKNDEMVEN